MKNSNLYSGEFACLEKANIDTDQIIPKQFLKSITKKGLGPYLFDAWRYNDEGYLGKKPADREINPDFVLNKSDYEGINVLIADENFGCGSSREHAVWALKDFGINVVIASSFGDIFFNNCFKNGVLAVKVSQESLNEIFKEQKENFQKQIEIDLINQKIKIPNIKTINFDIDDFRKNCLLEGLDDIGFSLKYESEITNYENKLKKLRPWILND
ncbi:3-isopropylmalate dehydratase small subunit [SAR86 cluster bacterium]|jgi:3-isopropylmalate/(R)-2-methylmalate dehydratase small subunit|nr:3-isopropylmalate dehydratase small subunit [SAR86 cluster bacterium]|tara:strand:+ start:5328 stop:5969 length:642 start_codon:yes stop_codon:yes gene_type:complete